MIYSSIPQTYFSQSSELITILQKHKPKNNSQIDILIGIQNEPVFLDLNEIGHLLVAGWAQSRKMKILDTILMSLMLQYTHPEVKFIIYSDSADFSQYDGENPYLYTEVIHDTDKVLSAFKWIIGEINNRYEKFHKERVRTITEHNTISGEKLPHIVIVLKTIDSLMDYYAAENEAFLRNITARGLNAGVHLIIATDKVTGKFVPSPILSNIPNRIIAQATEAADAKAAGAPEAHMLGADECYVKLLGRELQKATMLDVREEADGVARYIKSLPYKPPTSDAGSLDYRENMETDPFFDRAVAIISEFDKVSASLLQRRLKLGYARSARLLDELEAKGYIAAAEGSKPRVVLHNRIKGVRNILIIEDNKFIRDLISEKLTNSDYNVDQADNGEEGLKKIHNNKYDLILLAIMLTKKNGIEVLEDIFKDKIQNGKIVMFTNLNTEEIKKKTFELGAYDFWDKSKITPEELVNKIKIIFKEEK